MPKPSWVVIAGMLWACGSTSENGPEHHGAGGNSSGAKLDVSEFCDAWFVVVTEYLERCLPGSVDWSALFQQQDSCAQIVQTVASGRMRYDADVGAECLTRLPKLDCNVLFEGQTQTACSAFSGTLPDGAACNELASECVDGYCIASSGTCGAVCKSFVLEGGQCDAVNQCAINLRCENNVCSKRAGENEACAREGDCVAAFYCAGDSASQSGVCAPYQSRGAACAEDAACISGRCVDGTCVDHKPRGAACVMGGNECLRGLQCVSGICTDRLAQLGEPCSELVNTEYVRCASTLYCDRVAGTCQALRAPGESCTLARDCAGENPRCTNKICTACEGP